MAPALTEYRLAATGFTSVRLITPLHENGTATIISHRVWSGGCNNVFAIEGDRSNRLTKSLVLPWLSSRFQVGTSRTFWVVIAIAMLIALLFNMIRIPTCSIWSPECLSLSFFFVENVLRSNVSIFLLLFAFFGDYQLLKTAFWENATASLGFFSRSIVDDLLILLPFGCTTPSDGVDAVIADLRGRSHQGKTHNVGRTGRATAVIMILASSGAAVAFNIVVDRYVYAGGVRERDRLLGVVESCSVNKKNPTMKYSYKGAPT